ncbi:UDP-N-acetylmuramoyl-L-alanyl-D-glutamate--2,6-diaminopimelate ligase [Rhodococcus sp. MEB064]|uniref:UDP-N-acetylmuramoyl-L-alanyl-D-glutamate--2, 6-diaminopimelate ligase n=1 Tax=Rhodococcus sp. MEB064 TaxID=1587522 RepID=UPI000ADB1280|nr:UDP-N-acetylmuramoyl-L-alanyl-D-glutamate--2,6-diaminopimelate ligase [Rhodococcus sp. MEB064]
MSALSRRPERPSGGRPERSLTAVADAAGGRLTSPVESATVNDLCDDSRAVQPGDLYVALPGARWHGLDFEQDAVRAGAVAVLSDRPASSLPTIVVPNPRAVVGPLAAWFHGSPSTALTMFGVTGTNGKTSTTHFLHAGLRAAGVHAGVISGVAVSGGGTDETPVRTTPEATVLQRTLSTFVHNGCSAAALEVSSHAIAQHRIDGVEFEVAAFTNLGRDHLDFHTTMEEYYRTKASLFAPDRTRRAVIGIDDDHGRRLASECAVPSVTCSTLDPGADYYADRIDCTSHRTRFVARTPIADIPMSLQVLGPHQVSNALVALASLISGGVDAHRAAAGISALHSIPGRCEVVAAGQDFAAVVDYMHNVSGQHAILPYLRSTTTGRLVLVIGATGDRDVGKRFEIGATAARYADDIVVTDESANGEDPAALRADVLRGVRSVGRGVRVVEVADRRTAFEHAVASAGHGDTVVVAGRGSDTWQHFGGTSVYFDDRAELHDAIVALTPATLR